MPLNALYAIISILWAATVSAYALLLRSLASKEWVKDRLREEREADTERDRKLVTDLMAPLATQVAILIRETGALQAELAERHRENQKKLDRILADLDNDRYRNDK